jgi:hypothetical protein
MGIIPDLGKLWCKTPFNGQVTSKGKQDMCFVSHGDDIPVDWYTSRKVQYVITCAIISYLWYEIV